MLRVNTHDYLDKDPREKEAGGFLAGPGRFSLYTATHKSLISVARLRGWTVNKVEWVRVANNEGDMRVWLYPTDESDLDRLRLRHYKGKLAVNLSKVLTKWGMALPSGQQKQFDLQIDTDSPVGPALVFHMDKPLATKWTNTTKKKDEPSAQPLNPGADAPAGSE